MLYAQAYAGGEGSGSISFSTQLVDTCRSFFNGGDKSGSTLSQRKAKKRCFSFFGEQASGFDLIEQASNFDCDLFTGSQGQGFTSIQFFNPYTCTPFMASANGHDGFASALASDFNAGICLVVDLPIESSPLFAKIEDGNGKLYWSTYTELNNSGFEIQKSFDGLNWFNIGWIDGSAYSKQEIFYEFTDTDLREQVQYYRFAQIDLDATVSYSNTVALQPKRILIEPDIISIYPNPIVGNQTLNIRAYIDNEYPVTIIIFNSLGQAIFQEKFLINPSNNLVQLNIAAFNSGSYYILISSDDKTFHAKRKFLKID